VRPDLDIWLDDAPIRVRHRREAAVDEATLWEAARTVRVKDTRVLGRLLRWRIPGTSGSMPYDTLFREPPFAVLHEEEGALVSGLVGRIWTLRRDYPVIGPDEFRSCRARQRDTRPRHRPRRAARPHSRAPADHRVQRPDRSRGAGPRGGAGAGRRVGLAPRRAAEDHPHGARI
jgi:hypothetical protein